MASLRLAHIRSLTFRFRGAKMNKLWHTLAGKKYMRVSVWGLSPASPPANFACLGTETRHKLSGDGVRGGAAAEKRF